MVELISSDMIYVNSAFSEGSLAERNLAEGRGGEEQERSKKHRIACYRASVSKCSKYAPNTRLRALIALCKSQSGPRPHSYNQ